MNGEKPFSLYVEKGTFYADAAVTDGSGAPLIEIRKNNFTLKPPSWDSNHSPSALEVVDANTHPVFHMIRVDLTSLR